MRVRIVAVLVLALGLVDVLAPMPASAQTAPAEVVPASSVGSNWRSVSVGGLSACGIKANGRLYCWGGDADGLVGDGLPLVDQPAAVEVSGGGTNWSQVSVNDDVACAVKTTGRLLCWGSDFHGRLGNGGDDVDRASPFAVTGTNWTAVSVGTNHTCALRTAGTVWCWGSNDFEQLGLPSNVQTVEVPTRVGTASNWTSVSAGGVHTCGRRDTGRLFCWGADAWGSRGDGGGFGGDSDVPTEVAGHLTTWTSVTAGYGHVCARRSDQLLYCWGWDVAGQLGDGDGFENEDAPSAVDSNNWASVEAGYQHTCARRPTGEAACWGNDDHGALGDGGGDLTTDHPSGVTGAGGDWRSAVAGRSFSCGRKADGRLLCWGRGDNGRLGDGLGLTWSQTPVEVRDAIAFTGVETGRAHACGLSGGRLWCWGDDGDGQLGSGGGADEQLPVEVAGGVTTWTAIASGSDHTCGLRSTGRLFCWGDDDDGQLGNNAALADVSTPVQVAGGFTDWTDLSAGPDHTCARREVGRLYCWGSDGSGRLGDGGSDVGSPTPVEVSGALTTWSRYLAAGDEHTCATRSNGRLFCWGSDGERQLGTGAGDGTTGTPVQVSGAATNWTSVTAGGGHTCALKRGGRLYCWGDDADGQLGDDSLPNDRDVPTEVSGATHDWAGVDAGGQHTCATKVSKRLFCWGDDTEAQLGDAPPLVDSRVPSEVDGAVTRWLEVAAGGQFTCARMPTGRLWCWGADESGQTGTDLDPSHDVVPEQVFA